MGLSLFISNTNEFNLKLIHYLKQIEPDLYALIFDSESLKYLRTLSPKSATIEVGPIPQGIVRAEIIEKTERLVFNILNYLDNYNKGKIDDTRNKVTIFIKRDEKPYPKENGEITSYLHRALQDKDFCPLTKGSPFLKK
jgi:aspartoacylase